MIYLFKLSPTFATFYLQEISVLITMGSLHMLKEGLPSVDFVITCFTIINHSFCVLSFNMTSHICGISGLEPTKLAHYYPLTLPIQRVFHEGLYFLKNG